MKRYESAMRHLLDSYIRADDSAIVSEFAELGLVELIVKNGLEVLEKLPDGLKDPQAIAETIENNLRKTIVDENPVNPKYYEQMSQLLDDLIKERRDEAISYQEYLEQVKRLSRQVVQPFTTHYPPTLNTQAKKSLYDNLGKNEDLALSIDKVVRETKKEDWVGHHFKEREVAKVVREATAGYNIDVKEVVELLKNQPEYQ